MNIANHLQRYDHMSKIVFDVVVLIVGVGIYVLAIALKKCKVVRKWE